MSGSEPTGRQLRKSTILSRSQETRSPIAQLYKEKPQRYERNRRSLFKKRPFKAPQLSASTETTRAIVHRGRVLIVGDIVAIDIDDTTFYAQISGLLTDPYGEKSASLIWLVPSKLSGPHFDPYTYMHGLTDDLPRKLNAVKYVMHLPLNHFKAESSIA